MILKNDYYYYSEALSHTFCNDIIKMGNKINLGQARTGGYDEKDLRDKKKLKKLKNIRDSFVSFLDEWWIQRILKGYLIHANREAQWNFDIDLTEKMQFTRYAHNQYYHWHRDGWHQPYNNPKTPDLNGRIRKLSMVVQLSDPNDYTGGELEFGWAEPSKKLKIMKVPEFKFKGSVIVFPSFIFHRVRPVLSGIRYSLVLWSVGAPFK